MSDNSITPVGEHRRKRVRKGTRSCWECKRRKIKCVYQSEDHSICAGCLDKGTTCLSQEYVDDHSPREGNQALGQRMGRVEMMLEKLIEKVSAATEPERTSYGIDVLTPSSTPATTYDSAAPYMSLFDEVLTRQAEANTAPNISKPYGCEMPPPTMSNPATPATTCQKGFAPTTRLERLRRQLAAMLPCQEDFDYLSEMSQGWWLIRRHILPHVDKVPDHDFAKPFDVERVSTQHPMIIARLLLSVGLCIQQLPPDVDMRRLQTKVPLPEMMDKIMMTVSAKVTSDDELIGSMEGIECLILQGIFQVNAGNIRRSWLVFRRAVNVAQLMGFHRVSLKFRQEGPDMMETRRHYMWYQISKGDRYLSLILGVPSASGVTPFPFDDHAPWLSVEDLYNKQLCDISGLILARNQGDASHAFSITQEIDEKLDTLAKRMPRTWWELPATVLTDRTEEAASQFDRLLCQIWHFELESLVHLPFMLRAATDRRYEYSRVSCLSASRGLIRRWMVIRQSHGSSFVCNIVEFQAFIAAVTLLLGILGPTFSTSDPVVLRERADDAALVETVVGILEELKEYGSGVHVVNQSISIIRTLQGILRNEGSASGNLKLSIPHFGTISVARSGAVKSLDGERILGAAPRPDETVTSLGVSSILQGGRHNSAPSSSSSPSINSRDSNIANGWKPMPLHTPPVVSGYDNMNGSGGATSSNGAWSTQPILQFTSSQFPTLEKTGMEGATDEWPFQESDILLFDSLAYTDVEGNWDF